MKQAMEYAIENGISILAMPKTNLDWTQPTHTEQCTDLIPTCYKHHKLITSISKDKYPIPQKL